MAKRFQTWFGVPIPPFKEELFGSHSTTIRFVITGSIPSKKNNQQAITVRQSARDWVNEMKRQGKQPTWEMMHEAISRTTSKMRGNAKYIEFLEASRPVIKEQMQFWSKSLSSKGLMFPLTQATMSLRLYFKNRYITDTVNKQQTIQDLLVDCGVIANDDYNTLNPINSKSGCFYEEIIYDIAFISITTKLRS